jgi:hypothetical protein
MPTRSFLAILARCVAALPLLALLALLAVAPARAGEPQFPTGAHFGLEPPGAMKPSQAFPGFEDKTAAASILVVEIPPQAFPVAEKEMSAEGLKKQGMTEQNRETVTLKSGTATLVSGSQEVEKRKLRKWVLLTATPEVAALIAVQVPESERAAYSDEAIRAALLSMVTRASVPMDEQLTMLPFALGDLSGLRPFRVIPGNAVFLTDGPKDTLTAAEQPILVLSVSPGGPEKPNDRVNFARNLFTGFTDFKDIKIVGTDLIRTAGQQIAEIQAEAVDEKTNAPMKLVQWVRFGNNAFVRFVGAARADAWQQAFPRFRAVREGTKPR